MRLIAAARGMAGNVVCSVGGLRASRKPAIRLPDKSTAVGCGAGGWFYYVIGAAHYAAQQAPSQKMLAKPSKSAPSPAFRAGQRTPQ
jgi:hypothetical protein